MSKAFLDTLEQRRSYYNLSSSSPISDEAIESILKRVLEVVPSSFNSQSTRIVLLLHNDHKSLWTEALNILEGMGKANDATKQKMAAFRNGYGTVLFLEDETVVQRLQDSFTPYAKIFPQWAEHTSAMHQLAVWTALEQEGFGANLQHYQPLVDEFVQKSWNVPSTWTLKAQMVFGEPVGDKPAPRAPSAFAPPLDQHLIVAANRLPN